MDPSYIGSGVAFLHAVAKYGAGSFQRVILETFDNETDMVAWEEENVTIEVVQDRNS